MGLVVAAAVAVGAAIGLAPLAVFFARPFWWMAAIGAFFAMTLAVEARRAGRVPPVSRLSLAEWVLGCLTAAFNFATGSWLVLVVAGMMWLLDALLQVIERWTGLAWLIKVTAMGSKVEMFLVAVLLVAMAAEAIRSVWQSFDPPLPAIETPYQKRLRSGGKRLAVDAAIFVGVLAIVTVAWAWFFPLNWIYAVVLNGALITATQSFYLGTKEWPAFLAEQRKLLAVRAPEAVGEGVRAAGFALVDLPADVHESVGPLLEDIDLLVRRGERVCAIEIRTPGESDEPIEWTAGAGLQSAALAYETLVAGSGPVEPVMLLFGLKAGASIGRFAAEQTLRFIEIDPARVRSVLDPENRAARAALAREIMQDPIPAPAGGRP